MICPLTGREDPDWTLEMTEAFNRSQAEWDARHRPKLARTTIEDVAQAFGLNELPPPTADASESRCENINRAPGDDARAAAVENLIEDLNQNPGENLIAAPIAPAVEAPEQQDRSDEAYERQQEEEWAEEDEARAVRAARREEERKARAPRLAVDNPTPAPPALLPIAVARPELTLVHDADTNNALTSSALASDVEMIAQLAMNRIKMTLERPFSPDDPNYAQLLKFVCSVYGTTMNVIVRSDENRLKQRAVDRLPELLERVALEERKRAARTIEINPGEGPDAT